jgi:hypothetical protein
MDWRLIAAIAAASGSFGLVAVGARVVLTSSPPQRQAVGAAPTLAPASPPLLSLQPSSPGQTFPDQASTSAFAAQDGATPSRSDFPPEADLGPARVYALPPSTPPLLTDRPLNARPEPRAGYKAAALRPSDDALPREPPARPLIETKRPSVVPELQAALPASRYRGVLTSAEISRIRHNLRLTPEQEPAWPRVEAALAEMGRQQMALIRQGQEPRISPNEWPPSRLYAAAGPLLQTLRPDQKETIRKVARSLGFESVASML